MRISAGTYRMHNLSEFMKTLLQRFTRWFNRTHNRSGTLWEERCKSVIVESGIAARTMAAYIDLNPVRAGVAAGRDGEGGGSAADEYGSGVRRRAGAHSAHPRSGQGFVLAANC